MGYFSNGTEGEMYQQDYCDKCVHNDGCMVWLIHMVYNYDECNGNSNAKKIMSMLIPRKGISNEKCSMFVEVRK